MCSNAQQKEKNRKMKFNAAYFDAGIKRKGTHCSKWDGMLAQFGDPEMIPLWVADMDFPSAPAIQKAVKRVADQGTWGYPVSGREDAEALCSFWKRRHDTEILPEQVLMAPCVVSGMHIALHAMTKPGEGVLIMPPVYGPFSMSVKDCERPLVESLLLHEGNTWKMDFEDIEEKLKAGLAKAVMLCSPHNPCGRAWTRTELETLMQLCRRYHVGLISDEIHADFVLGGIRHVSVLDLSTEEDPVIMLCAASKTFNVAGLQQSAIVVKGEALREQVRTEIARSGVTSGNAFSLEATKAAYTQCDEWLDGLLLYLEDNRKLVYEALKEWPHVHVSELEATYLMWIDCRELGLEQQELMDRIHSCHVHVNDGLFFGEAGRGFIRLNIACPRAQLAEGLRRLKDVLGK